MEKPHRMAQVYGYIVCLVAVIAFLISIAQIMTSLMDLQDPIHAETFVPAGTPSLASFENYKMDIMKSTSRDEQKVQLSWSPDDNTMRSMYESARADRINNARHSAYRSLMTNGLIIIISLALFITHWMWLRRLRAIPVLQPGGFAEG